MNAAGDGTPRRVLGVATLTRPHGVRGELKLRSSPDMLDVLRQVCEADVDVVLRMPDGHERPVAIRELRGSDAAAIIQLEGVEDRSAAEQLRGAVLAVERAMLPQLEEDEYYLADLEGCDVIDAASGRVVGSVRRAEALPANVVLTIVTGDGRTIYAPLADDAVPVVDVDARRVEVDLQFLGVDDA